MATITLKVTGDFGVMAPNAIIEMFLGQWQMRHYPIISCTAEVRQLHINELETKSAHEIAYATLLDDDYHRGIQQTAALLLVKGMGDYQYITSNGEGANRSTRWSNPDNSEVSVCVTADGRIEF